MDKFQFSKLFKAHRDCIRSVSLFRNPVDGKQKLITVSRDAEAKVFPITDSGTVEFDSEFSFYLPTQISIVCVVERDNFNCAFFIFGCLNGHIYTFNGYDLNASQTLTNHSQNVTIIRSNSVGTRVASGSWDKECTIYNFDHVTGQMSVFAKISHHTESVMDVVFVSSDRLLTASSDRSIVLWDIGNEFNMFYQPKQIRAYLGHEDCVRGLLVDSSLKSFYSISNDQTIRMWDLNSTHCHKIYVGHTHFIFGIAHLDQEHFLSCGENNIVCIWNKNQTNPLQTLHLPAITIWSVVAINDSVIVAVGSDGNIYVYTTRQELFGDASFQNQFDDLIARQNVVPYETVSHLDLFEECSLRDNPAKSVGERRLIRSIDDNQVVLYEWRDRWAPIGHVSDYVFSDVVNHTTGRLLFNGEYYDEVLKVKLNGKSYKLPFNRNEDIWLVASDFLQKNQLDSEVLSYLVKSMVSCATYNPKQVTYTYNYFPLTEFKLFTQLSNVESFRLKFEEFNQKAAEEYQLDANKIEMIAKELQEPSVNCVDFIESYQLLFNWKENRFIIYDLLRITLADKYFNTFFLHRFEDSLFRQDQVLGSLLRDIPTDSMPLQLTSFRVLCNLFSTIHGAEFMYKNFDYIFHTCLKWTQLVDNRNVHQSYASIWYNYSILLVDVRKLQNNSFKQCLMRKIMESTEIENSFDISVLQTLYAYGNLLSTNFKGEMQEHYQNLIQAYPKKFKDCTDIRACIGKINLISDLL